MRERGEGERSGETRTSFVFFTALNIFAVFPYCAATSSLNRATAISRCCRRSGGAWGAVRSMSRRLSASRGEPCRTQKTQNEANR